MNDREATYAKHLIELVAEREEIDLDAVAVKIEYDQFNVMEPVITYTNDNGRWTGKMHDGESLDDVRWMPA